MYEPLSEKEEQIATAIVDAAYKVHSELGPGLLESIYETCFCHELAQKGWKYQRQVSMPINYAGLIFDEGFRLDVLVDNLVVCELKAVSALLPVHEAQLLSYLKLAGKRLSFLIIFNVPFIKKGIKRKIL